MRKSFLAAAALASLTTACDDGESTGQLDVLLEPEDTITEGLQAGDGVEDIADGWSASFERYIVVVGDVDVQYASDPDVSDEAGDVFAVDLTTLPESGSVFWSFESLKQGDWTPFYSLVGAADGAMRDESVSEALFDEMVDGDWTYLIEGSIEKEDGMSCPPASLAAPGDKAPNGTPNRGGDDCYDATEVSFRWGVDDVETLFGPCSIDGQDGFNVPSGGSQTVALTLHGDHMFFNGFPQGDEGGVVRLAQWIADCDLDLDGEVTREELESIALSDLPEINDRYNTSGPIEIEHMWDYLRAQLKTQGHFQGEGECAVDGEEHDHGHDHDHEGHDEEDHDEHEDE